MSREDTSGRILWSTESKHYLLQLIKDNMVIISPDVSAETMVKKGNAWRVIEEKFAADGMQYTLSKLKRLWKRMKDTARQNVMKFNEQKKRNVKLIKVPSALDMDVAEMIAIRNFNKNKARERARAAGKIRYDRGGPAMTRPRRASAPPPEEEDDDDNVEEDDGNYEMENGESYNGYGQSDDNRINGFNDLLEPMTILEEFEDKSSVHQNNRHHNNNTIADEQPQLLESMPDVSFIRSSGQKKLQDELLLQEIKLKEIQRQNEEERMQYDRELFNKKSILLDMQIKKLKIELEHLNGGEN